MSNLLFDTDIISMRDLSLDQINMVLKLAKQWEKAEIESWLNYEKNNVKKGGKK